MILERKYGMNRNFLEKAREQVAQKLTENHIHFTLEGRVKSVYSIYRKMYNQNKSFDEIYDFYALRIIVETELECYTSLGVIHDMFNSMPGVSRIIFRRRSPICTVPCTQRLSGAMAYPLRYRFGRVKCTRSRVWCGCALEI